MEDEKTWDGAETATHEAPSASRQLVEQLDLDAIKARASAAKIDGPRDEWEWRGRVEAIGVVGSVRHEAKVVTVAVGVERPRAFLPSMVPSSPDEEVIIAALRGLLEENAHAGADVPALVAEVERLRGEAAQLQSLLDDTRAAVRVPLPRIEPHEKALLAPLLKPEAALTMSASAVMRLRKITATAEAWGAALAGHRWHAAVTHLDDLYGLLGHGSMMTRAEFESAEIAKLRNELHAAREEHHAAAELALMRLGERERAREEAAAWKALAQSRSTRGIPMLDMGLEMRRRQLAGDEALATLRALGIDPDAP